MTRDEIKFITEVCRDALHAVDRMKSEIRGSRARDETLALCAAMLKHDYRRVSYQGEKHEDLHVDVESRLVKAINVMSAATLRDEAAERDRVANEARRKSELAEKRARRATKPNRKKGAADGK